MSESLISEMSSADECEIPVIKKVKIISENLFLISSISNVLENLLEQNKKLKSYKTSLKKQSSMIYSKGKKYKISIIHFLERIFKYLHPEDSTIIIALILIDRLCNSKNINLNEYNIHKIIFSSLLISIKYNEDHIYSYDYYALISGISKKELGKLEMSFLNDLNYNIFVNQEVYEKYFYYLNEDLF